MPPQSGNDGGNNTGKQKMNLFRCGPTARIFSTITLRSRRLLSGFKSQKPFNLQILEGQFWLQHQGFHFAPTASNWTIRMAIFAPWTPQQVENLNRWQNAGHVHPFTCPNDHDDRVLVADEDGWHCPTCDYAQNWAHEWMLSGPPDNPFYGTRPASGTTS